jgi:hypothetical protein
MSFGKFLAAGKSFVNGRGMVAYRENKRAYLPKFGPAKNPFAPATEAELPKPPVESPVARVKQVAAPVWAKTQKMPAISATPKPLTVWTSRRNPISMWLYSQPAAQNVLPVVQSELSLDSVKVVHNDLSDAEVEVVPIKSRPAREAAKPVSAPAGGENSWSRLSAKFFGANAT